MKKLLLIILLVIFIIFSYGKFIEPRNLIVNEYIIEAKDLEKTYKDLKIVHFSDLLYNNDNKRLDKIKDKINSLNADIIVFSGDLVHKDFKYEEYDFDDLKKFLSGLNASLYKYSVIGDNDKKFIDKYKDIMYESDFNLLDNDYFLLFYKSEIPVNIIGLTDMKDYEKLLESEIEYKYSIAITHKPDNAKKLKNKVDLVLAGHSLGGVIKLPFAGGIIKKDGANDYVDDYYELDKTSLYISNGLGYENFDFRLFNSPSINVYRFK